MYLCIRSSTVIDRRPLVVLCSRPNLIVQAKAHLSGSKRLIKDIFLVIFTRFNHNRIFKDSPDRFFWCKTTTWCHHIYCRRLPRMITRKNQFTNVVTTLINAILGTPYTVIALRHIFKIRLKGKFIRKISKITKITYFNIDVRNRIVLNVFVFRGQPWKVKGGFEV